MKWYIKKKILSYSRMHTFLFNLNLYDKIPVMEIDLNSEDCKKLYFRPVKIVDKIFVNKVLDSFKKMDIKPNFTITELKSRIDLGHFLTITETDNNEIVGWTWAAVKEVFFSDFNSKIKLHRDHSFSYNDYVHKNYRGKRLNHFMKEINFHNLKLNGYNYIWSLVHTWNESSIKSLKNMKWDLVGDYRFLKLLFLNFHFPPEKLK